MTEIHIRRTHHVPHAEARAAAEFVAAELRRKHAFHWLWQEDRIVFSRDALSGVLSLADEAVEVRLELGAPLDPQRDLIEGEVHGLLKTAFGQA